MKRTRYNIVKTISCLVTFFGFIKVYGAAGSSDLGISTTNQLIQNSLSGLSIMLIGIIVFLITNILHKRYIKSIQKKRYRRDSYRRFIRNMILLEMSN